MKEIIVDACMMMTGSDLGYFWLIMAIIFLFAEIGTPGLFFFVAFAVGCVFASIAAFSGFVLYIQCFVSLGVLLLTFVFIRLRFTSSNVRSDQTNIYALVGREAHVIKKICPHHKGQVKVGGENWTAIADCKLELCVGMVVEVIGIRGNTLIVKKYNT